MDMPISRSRAEQEKLIDIEAVAGAIVAAQLDSGEIPWTSGQKSDPWDHTEAAMGLTIGGAGAGWMLDAFGFVPNAEQDETAMTGILLMFSVVPGALAILNAVFLWFYPLSREETERMQSELAERRAKALEP